MGNEYVKELKDEINSLRQSISQARSDMYDDIDGYYY